MIKFYYNKNTFQLIDIDDNNESIIKGDRGTKELGFLFGEGNTINDFVLDETITLEFGGRLNYERPDGETTNNIYLTPFEGYYKITVNDWMTQVSGASLLTARLRKVVEEETTYTNFGIAMLPIEDGSSEGDQTITEAQYEAIEEAVDQLAEDIITNTNDITDLENNKVDKTQTIAGIDLQDNITKEELKTGLDIDNIEVDIQTLENDKVDKTTTIAGIDLQDNITQSELKEALDIDDLENEKENVINKVTAFSNPTDIQYPSAKLVSDNLDLKVNLFLNQPLEDLNGLSLKEVFEDNNLSEGKSLSTVPERSYVSNGILYEKATTSTHYAQIVFTSNLNANDDVYVVYEYEKLSDRNMQLEFYNVNGVYKQEFSPVMTTIDMYSSIYELPNDLGVINVIFRYAPHYSSTTYLGVEDLAIFGLAIPKVIDLTTLGITADKDTLDKWHNVYQLLTNYNELSYVDTKADIEQEDWIEPTLTNATSTYLKYRKDNFGTVIIEGNLTLTTAGTNFTLPTGYRPLFTYVNGDLTFNTDGTVVSSATGVKYISVRFTGGA